MVLLEALDGLADCPGAEAGVVHDLGDGVGEGFLVPSAASGLMAAKDEQHLEFGAAEVGKMLDDSERDPHTARPGRGGRGPGNGHCSEQ